MAAAEQTEFEIEDGILKAYHGSETEITIPEGVHTIADGALKGLTGILAVYFPTTLRKLGNAVFKGCRQLKKVSINEGLEHGENSQVLFNGSWPVGILSAIASRLCCEHNKAFALAAPSAQGIRGTLRVPEGANAVELLKSLDDLLDAWEKGRDLPSNPIVLTFDDGHIDIYKNVFPILQKYNMRATVFLVTDHIGMKDYLTWDLVRALQAGGFVDFESRTMSYKNLTTLKGDKLWNEIYGSKQAIEWALKKPAKFIAYPDGKYSTAAEETSKECGFRAGFIEDYGLAANDSNAYVLTRIPVRGSNDNTLFRFKLRLKGAPLFAPIHRFKMDIAEGNPEIADLIFIP